MRVDQVLGRTEWISGEPLLTVLLMCASHVLQLAPNLSPKRDDESNDILEIEDLENGGSGRTIFGEVVRSVPTSELRDEETNIRYGEGFQKSAPSQGKSKNKQQTVIKQSATPCSEPIPSEHSTGRGNRVPEKERQERDNVQIASTFLKET